MKLYNCYVIKYCKAVTKYLKKINENCVIFALTLLDIFWLNIRQFLQLEMDPEQQRQREREPLELVEEQDAAMEVDDDSDIEEFDEDLEASDSDFDEDNGDDVEEESDEYSVFSANSEDFMLVTANSPQKTLPVKEPYAFKPFCLIKENYKEGNSKTIKPIARSGHRVTADEKNLYSLGGYNPNAALANHVRGQCVLFQELWRYNLATKKWTLIMNAPKVPNMPRELASNALIMHKNVLISHGGTGYPFGETCSNECFIYTTGKIPIVSRLEVTGELPAALYGPGIVLHENYLYTIGGTTGFDYSCDVYRLNLKTKVWEMVYICRPEMRDDPEGRYRHEVVYDGHHIYVLGGGTSVTVYDLQHIPAFNLKTSSWDYFDSIPDPRYKKCGVPPEEVYADAFPKPRKCFTCVQHTATNGDIEAFITGGLQGDFATYYADIWKLNLRTKQWTRIETASLPKPLYFHSAANTGIGCMYIFGGIEYTSKEMKRRNELYKMWITIPKLSEICWEAITYYNKRLDTYDRDTLLKVGIPSNFVDRLNLLPVAKQRPYSSSSDLEQAIKSDANGAKRSRTQCTSF